VASPNAVSMVPRAGQQPDKRMLPLIRVPLRDAEVLQYVRRWNSCERRRSHQKVIAKGAALLALVDKRGEALRDWERHLL
jgi:hypothetical protein